MVGCMWGEKIVLVILLVLVIGWGDVLDFDHEQEHESRARG